MIAGKCPVCRKKTRFHAHYSFSGENLVFCEKCNHPISEKALLSWYQRRGWAVRYVLPDEPNSGEATCKGD